MSSKETLIDQMAADVEAVDAPAEFPAGTPEFKSYLALRPRSRRAEFKRVLAQVAEMSPQLKREQAAIAKLKEEGAREAASMRLWASLDELYELVEKALRLVAVDAEKFDAWAAEVDDDTLQLVWAVYQQKAQPGEASSSAS